MARTTPVGFEEKKAAQIANFFAGKFPDGVDKMKLIKLIYLSEREFVSRHGHPMLFDELYSLQHGPICSSALNGLNAELDEKLWAEFIAKDDNTITARQVLARDQLDHISDAELTVLQDTFNHYKLREAIALARHEGALSGDVEVEGWCLHQSG